MPTTNRNSRSIPTQNGGPSSSLTRPRCWPTCLAAMRCSAAARCCRTWSTMSAAGAAAGSSWWATTRSCRPWGAISVRRSTRRRCPPTARWSTARWTRWSARRRSRVSSSMPRSYAACSSRESTRFRVSTWISRISSHLRAATSSRRCRTAMRATGATSASSSPVRTSVRTVIIMVSATTCSTPRRRLRAATC